MVNIQMKSSTIDQGANVQTNGFELLKDEADAEQMANLISWGANAVDRLKIGIGKSE